MLKEKLGLCPYEIICDEQEFILMPEIQNTNKNLIKKLDKKLIEQSDDELTEQSHDELIEQSDKKLIKQSDEELIKTKSLKKNENTTNWFDKNKFKKVLATVKINNFNHKNKIGKLKFNDINNLINKIKNNTVSEAFAKPKLNVLKEIKKQEQKINVLLMDKKYY